MSADADIVDFTNQMPRLSDRSIGTLGDAASRYRYDRSATNIGIVHLGPGAFHRAHQAYYTDEMINRTGGHWGICEVSLRSSGTRDRLRPQDNLYTLCELGARKRFRIIGAIKEFLVADEDVSKVINRIAQPSVKAITLTITEKGYCLTAEGRLDLRHPAIVSDLAKPSSPKSAIGVIVAGLQARRDNRIGPVVVLSCDNLAGNGLQLRNAVTKYAEMIDSGLSNWIAANIPFPSTMVDSITPATTEDAIKLVVQSTALYDAAPIQREPFTQWIIEDMPGVILPPWKIAGAQLVRDVRPFEIAKLRILNGLHTSAAFLGLYAGLETVEEAVKHRHIRRFLEWLCVEEILPTLPLCSDLDLEVYTAQVFERFENSGLRYELAQITWDSSKKLPYRIVNSLVDNVSTGRRGSGLCTVLAAWISFLHRRVAEATPIVDPLSESLKKALGGPINSTDELVSTVFDAAKLLPADFSADADVLDSVAQQFERMQNLHPEAFLESVVGDIDQGRE